MKYIKLFEDYKTALQVIQKNVGKYAKDGKDTLDIIINKETHTLKNIEPYIVKFVGKTFMVFISGDMDGWKYELVLIPKSIGDTIVYNKKGSDGFLRDWDKELSDIFYTPFGHLNQNDSQMFWLWKDL